MLEIRYLTSHILYDVEVYNSRMNEISDKK